MKNTNKNTNKVIRRTTGLALSAVMLMSVAGTTLCSSVAAANMASADEVAISAKTQVSRAPEKVERLDEVRINDGRVYTPGSFNWFAVRNTNDSKKTYITAIHEDGQVTIKIYDLEQNLVASVAGDMSETGYIKAEIPMNEDDGCFYFINVSQDPETASTSNFSVNHLDQTYMDTIEGKGEKEESKQENPGSGNGKIERMDVLKGHDGRVYEPGTDNWFAVKNTADGKQTYVTASGENGEVTITVYDTERNIVSTVTGDMSETDFIKTEIPMNEDGGAFYFVNVTQNSEKLSSENFSVNHLSQGYINTFESTVADFGETLTVKSQPVEIENMDGTTTTVTVKANNENGSAEKTYTYTKEDPSLTQKIYFDNSSYNWSNIYAYIYLNNTENAAWPGQKMTLDSSTGYYVIEVDDTLANGAVIFSDGTNSADKRYPAHMQPGLALEGTTKIFKAGNKFENYRPTTTQPTQPTTKPTTQPVTTQPVTTQPVTTQPVTTPTERVLIGDVNQDGDISINDVTEIQLHLAEKKTLVGNNLIAADANGDRVIDVKDATLVQLYIVNLSVSDSKVGTYTG